MNAPNDNPIKLGEQVPWFDVRTLAGYSFYLGTAGGHWVVLCFLGGLPEGRLEETIAGFLAESDLFRFQHMVFFGICAQPPPNAQDLIRRSQLTFGFIPDYAGEISRSFGAFDSPRVVVLDPMLNAVGNFPLGEGGMPVERIRQFLHGLPPVDQFAGVALTAPVLIAPRILEEAACSFLIDLYNQDGGKESGVLQGRDRSASSIDHDHKRRRDYSVADPGERDFIHERIVHRLVPAITRFF